MYDIHPDYTHIPDTVDRDEVAAAWWYTFRFYGANEALYLMVKWGF